jgi:uncharacterized protein (DUF983 family)
MLWQDREQHSTPFFLLFNLPYRTIFSVLCPLAKIRFTDNIKENNLCMPMFYTQDSDDVKSALLALCVIGTIFGTVHLLAWASESPLGCELLLWHVSALVLTMVLFLMLLGVASHTLE